jgi:hypothetical protein
LWLFYSLQFPLRAAIVVTRPGGQKPWLRYWRFQHRFYNSNRSSNTRVTGPWSSGVPRGGVWGVQTPPKFRNFDKVPKIKKILLYEMKFLVPYYSCLQNPWLGDHCPQIPILSVLNWISWTPPNKIPGYATAVITAGCENRVWQISCGENRVTWTRMLMDPCIT